MDTDAENLDYGIFNLTWTHSEGSDNYSIYKSNGDMDYISKNFDVLAYQTETRPFPISLKKEDYYFRVVAYNETGETMSLNSVNVNIPGPGSFQLYCDADNPDDDGRFNLVWSLSDRATNYSVYQHNDMITEINESLKLLVNQTTATSSPVTVLRDGKYYFAVAAYSDMGYTLSDNEDVVVQLAFDWRIILVVSIGSVAGVASIVLVRKYLSRKSEIKKSYDKHKHKQKSPKNNMNK